MSLLFDASTEKVSVGSGATLDDLQTLTTLQWIYIPGLAPVDGRIWQKAYFGGHSTFHLLTLIRTAAIIENEYARATTSQYTKAALANFSVYGTGKWLFVVTTSDPSTDASNKLYMGDLTTAPAEPSAYTNQRAGSGAFTADSAAALYFGNKENDGANVDARIAYAMWCNAILTQADINQQWRQMRLISPTVGFWHFGRGGTGTQFDYSGNANNGTVTGATVADNPPIVPWRFWQGHNFAPPLGGITYTETGVAVSPAVAAGPDQAIFTEQGQPAAPGIAAGPDQTIFVEQGAPTSPAVAAGADQAVWSESSPAVAPAVAAGADATTFTETGEADSPAVATAQDQAIWQEQGSPTAPAVVTAEDQAVWQEQGSSTAPAVAAGPDEFTAVESGAAASPAVASGQSQLISAGGGTLYVKTGEAAAPGVAAGPDQFIAAETSAAVSPAVAEGTDQAIFSEMGAAVATAVAAGQAVLPGAGGASDMNWVPFADAFGLQDPNVEIIVHGRKRRKQPEPELAYADEEVLLMLV